MLLLIGSSIIQLLPSSASKNIAMKRSKTSLQNVPKMGQNIESLLGLNDTGWIPYHPAIANACAALLPKQCKGDAITCALFIALAYRFTGRSSSSSCVDGWFYKRSNEFQEELCCNRRVFDRVVDFVCNRWLLVDRQLRTFKGGVLSYYRLNIQNLNGWWLSNGLQPSLPLPTGDQRGLPTGDQRGLLTGEQRGLLTGEQVTEKHTEKHTNDDDEKNNNSSRSVAKKTEITASSVDVFLNREAMRMILIDLDEAGRKKIMGYLVPIEPNVGWLAAQMSKVKQAQNVNDYRAYFVAICLREIEQCLLNRPEDVMSTPVLAEYVEII